MMLQWVWHSKHFQQSSRRGWWWAVLPKNQPLMYLEPSYETTAAKSSPWQKLGWRSGYKATARFVTNKSGKLQSRSKQCLSGDSRTCVEWNAPNVTSCCISGLQGSVDYRSNNKYLLLYGGTHLMHTCTLTSRLTGRMLGGISFGDKEQINNLLSESRIWNHCTV